MKPIWHALGALALSALSVAALADDSAWSSVGGAGTFTKNSHIQMFSEVVWLQLAPRVSHVHATFHFLNLGPQRTVEMAFPERFWHGDTTPSIMRFSSWVDGHRVAVHPQMPQPDSFAEETWGYHRAWVKRVAFGTHQRRTVVVDFDALNGDTMLGQAQRYILKSGASWSGVIKSCTVHIDWSRITGSEPQITFTGHDRTIGPRPRDHKRCTLHWAALKPDFDIDCAWYPSGITAFINGEDFDAGVVPEEPLPYVRGEGRNVQVATECILNFDSR